MTDEPPNDPAAEAGVLGAVLQSPAALTEVAPLLAGEDFYRPAHELIWDAVIALADAGEGVDPITVADCTTRAGTLDRAGGFPHLHDLVAGVPTASNAGFYAGIVRDRAARRRLATAGTRIGDTIDDFLESLEERVATEGLVRWPWRDADHLLAPMSPGQLILVGARPSMGKSVSVVDAARDAAIRQGKTVVLHSLEMSRDEVLQRIISAEARVPFNAIRDRAVTEEHWGRIATARAALAEADLHIVDAPNVGLADLRASVEKHKPDLLALDYIQLGQVNPKVDRRTGLEELVRGLKLLAKSAGIPILTAAQLGRGPDLRNDHTPQMADLRETGSLEMDADVVALLHRPDYYEPECARAGEVDVIVAKQRNGPKGTVTLVHQFHYSRFVDMAA